MDERDKAIRDPKSYQKTMVQKIPAIRAWWTWGRGPGGKRRLSQRQGGYSKVEPSEDAVPAQKAGGPQPHHRVEGLGGDDLRTLGMEEGMTWGREVHAEAYGVTTG